MALSLQSRNPFADPGDPSLADLVERIRVDDDLPVRTKQNWSWALRTASRAIGKEPAAVPAHPKFLRAALERAAPDAIGISRSAWNNCRSLCGKVLNWAGLASIPGHYQAPFAPGWAELWAKLPPESALRHQLGRLFHYASAQGIAVADNHRAGSRSP